MWQTGWAGVRTFVVTRSDGHLQTVQAFEPGKEREALDYLNVARECEGLEAEMFDGDDLVQVVQSHEGFFTEAGSTEARAA